MLDHVTLRTTDRDAAERFFATVLPVIGRAVTSRGTFVEWDDFSIASADDEHPVTRGLHVGFGAPSREHVNAFWQAGVDAGYADDGAPGPRRQYGEDYYGGFLRDHDGNSIEAVHHRTVRPPGGIDHLWIRVTDVAAARDFYELIAPHAGVQLVDRLIEDDEPARARFAFAGGSFSLVDGPATQNAHVAFAAPDRATVDAFHAAAVAAGFADHGPPGERAQYAPGYYAAYVLDPDANNVEVVHHDLR